MFAWIATMGLARMRAQQRRGGLGRIGGTVISTDALEQQMIHSKQASWSRTAGAFIGAGLLALSGVALATDQAEQRRDGRDAKQDSKDQARKNKVDCKATDQNGIVAAKIVAGYSY